MKQDRPFPAVTVTKKAELALRSGHPWVYAAEITAREGDCPSGGIVDVFAPKGAWLGAGFYSAESKIGVRVLSDNANERFGPAFFERRVKYALDYRRAVMGRDFACCRLIFGEADGLPGLTVDRFSNLLSAQVLSRGTDGVKDVIYSALLAQLEAMGERIDGIYERNESPIRALEGLEQYKGWYAGAPHPESALTEICENGVRYAVDLENGQKTGFFLDQKYNRLAVARLAAGRRVLDCFTHTGSFALNCARAGAEHVTAVDASESAVALARQNAALNGLEDKMDFLAADVFDLLPKLTEERADYGLVILDPPAFTKSRRTVAGAERGYHEINYRAMRLLPRGGYLATCSCSHFMPPALFEKMLRSAARDANVSLKQIEARQQAPDHPILWNVPETEYLKFYIFQVV
ncbi:MAG TPA: class I SAM-dependent rRNA methyltransferase [Candidatus Scatomorpha stercorigallinarum]|nr:class I SAM-dependent rRNA methyltransferase [Candidatus Scatomorpha stercorigallinarum]